MDLDEALEILHNEGYLTEEHKPKSVLNFI